MASGTKADFVIYNEQVQTGILEAVADNIQLFNERSNNAIILESEFTMGDFKSEAFFQAVGDVIQHRDTTSLDDLDASKLTQIEAKAVDMARTGMFEATLDSFRRAGLSAEDFSERVGQALGEAIVKDMVKTALIGVIASVGSNADMVVDDSENDIKQTSLSLGKAKFGDRLDAVRAFVMHSDNYYKLVGDAIVDQRDTVGGVAVNSGTIHTQGLPVIVTDLAPLKTDTELITLALVAGAVTVTENHSPETVTEAVTGKANLIMRTQTEYTFLAEFAGYSYKGGANPDDATFGASANWEKIATSNKHTAGALIKNKV